MVLKYAVMENLGIGLLSAHVFQVELSAHRIAVLDVVGMPKLIDWCFIHRSDATFNPVNTAFKAFVLAEGPRVAAYVLN